MSDQPEGRSGGETDGRESSPADSEWSLLGEETAGKSMEKREMSAAKESSDEPYGTPEDRVEASENCSAALATHTPVLEILETGDPVDHRAGCTNNSGMPSQEEQVDQEHCGSDDDNDVRLALNSIVDKVSAAEASFSTIYHSPSFSSSSSPSSQPQPRHEDDEEKATSEVSTEQIQLALARSLRLKEERLAKGVQVDVKIREEFEKRERNLAALPCASSSSQPLGPFPQAQPNAGFQLHVLPRVPLLSSPQRCDVHYDYQREGEEPKTPLGVRCFGATPRWSVIHNRLLREHIARLYPAPLPFQAHIYTVVLDGDKIDVDGNFVCPSGQGRTVGWVIPTLDHILTHEWKTRPGRVPVVVVQPNEALVEATVDELLLHVPRKGDGRPYAEILKLVEQNRDAVERKLDKEGLKLLVTTPNLLVNLQRTTGVPIDRIVFDNADMVEEAEWTRTLGKLVEYYDMWDYKLFKTIVLSESSRTEHIFQFPRRNVVHVKATLPELEQPRLEFAYENTDSEAYDHLREVVDGNRRGGTTVVFVEDNDVEQIWTKLAENLGSRLHIQYLDRSMHVDERTRRLFEFRAGRIDVLITVWSDRHLVESIHRKFTIFFLYEYKFHLPTFVEYLRRRDRIYAADSLVFLSEKNEKVASQLLTAASEAGTEAERQLKEIRYMINVAEVRRSSMERYERESSRVPRADRDDIDPRGSREPRDELRRQPQYLRSREFYEQNGRY